MMKKNFFPWRLGAMLVLGMVTMLLAYHFKTGHAAPTVPEDAHLGSWGYLRQSRPVPLEVEVQDVQVTPQAVVATLCIEMPTLEPWNPYATLTIGNEEVPNAEVRLLNAKDPDVMQQKTRCYAFTFPVDQGRLQAQRATLRLEALWLELGNGYWDDEVVAQLHARAQKVAPGLKFEVVHERGEFGGGAYLKFHALPEGMTTEQAILLVQRLGMDEIPVAWETTLALK